MAGRPRRAAAQKATTAITDMADRDNSTSNNRTNRIMSSTRPSRRSDVKLPGSKLRESTSSRNSDSYPGGEIVAGKRNRGPKKSYVVDTSEDEEDEVRVAANNDDEDAEGEDEDMDDAEGEIVVEDDMEVDAEGEDDDLGDEDAEGEEDEMDVDSTPQRLPVIKVSKPIKPLPSSKSKGPLKSALKQTVPQRDSDDDEELSELDSDVEEIEDTVQVGGEGEEDAEGEEEGLEGGPGEGEEEDDEELDSDDETPGGGSRAETPDLTKMTKRQRARFQDDDGHLLKLSDEVQVKKHFTAEELSMRRAEMARRRRNLSEKRTEEVKMETINKLLKKQAPKTNRKGQLAGDDTPGGDANKPSPVFVRWVSTKDGSRVAVPDEMLSGPTGKVFMGNSSGGMSNGKIVQEVS